MRPLYQPSVVPARPFMSWRLVLTGFLLATVLLPLAIALAWEVDGILHPSMPFEEKAP